jgi:hypothetical protein
MTLSCPTGLIGKIVTRVFADVQTVSVLGVIPKSYTDADHFFENLNYEKARDITNKKLFLVGTKNSLDIS